MNSKTMPCGCIFSWEDGRFTLSLCRTHGRQYEQKQLIDYGPKENRRSFSPYG